MLHKIRNQPKNQPPHQGEMTSKSTNQKTIGINKHGTLLSSQTTEAIHVISIYICVSVLRYF